jgi:peptidoglycan hydrolase-like protein with peptidoglycan-binding domain
LNERARVASKQIMKRMALAAAFVFLNLVCVVRADDAIASAQQALKEQGFYYGAISGRKDADTTGAIRRYQIRNGLKITGELDTETQRSLRSTGGTTPTRRRIAPRQAPPEDDSELRDEEPRSYEPSPQYRSPRDLTPPAYAPEPYRYRQESYGIFAGTPYERASVDVQQRIVFDAQIFLARRGYYRSGIDGVFGPGTEFALRAFQSRSGLPPTGRFDVPTLGALGLMPGQHFPRRRFPPRSFPHPVYRGEWIPG